MATPMAPTIGAGRRGASWTELARQVLPAMSLRGPSLPTTPMRLAARGTFQEFLPRRRRLQLRGQAMPGAMGYAARTCSTGEASDVFKGSAMAYCSYDACGAQVRYTTGSRDMRDVSLDTDIPSRRSPRAPRTRAVRGGLFGATSTAQHSSRCAPPGSAVTGRLDLPRAP
jgi:hypothetical protein